MSANTVEVEFVENREIEGIRYGTMKSEDFSDGNTVIVWAVDVNGERQESGGDCIWLCVELDCSDVPYGLSDRC